MLKTFRITFPPSGIKLYLKRGMSSVIIWCFGFEAWYSNNMQHLWKNQSLKYTELTNQIFAIPKKKTSFVENTSLVQQNINTQLQEVQICRSNVSVISTCKWKPCYQLCIYLVTNMFMILNYLYCTRWRVVGSWRWLSI